MTLLERPKLSLTENRQTTVWGGRSLRQPTAKSSAVCCSPTGADFQPYPAAFESAMSCSGSVVPRSFATPPVRCPPIMLL
jgi:hypothetical protein